MSNRVLFLAFTLSVIGLLILTYVSESLEPPLSQISDITTNDLGKNVHIEGNVKSVHEFSGGSILLTVEDKTDEISVYLPYNVATNFSKQKLEDKKIKIIGEVQVYNGKLEILVEDINNLSIK